MKKKIWHTTKTTTLYENDAAGHVHNVVNESLRPCHNLSVTYDMRAAYDAAVEEIERVIGPVDGKDPNLTSTVTVTKSYKTRAAADNAYRKLSADPRVIRRAVEDGYTVS